MTDREPSSCSVSIAPRTSARAAKDRTTKSMANEKPNFIKTTKGQNYLAFSGIIANLITAQL